MVARSKQLIRCLGEARASIEIRFSDEIWPPSPGAARRDVYLSKGTPPDELSIHLSVSLLGQTICSCSGTEVPVTSKRQDFADEWKSFNCPSIDRHRSPWISQSRRFTGHRLGSPRLARPSLKATAAFSNVKRYAML